VSVVTGTPRSASARRARIAALITTHEISSQEELGRLLADDGIHVTQTTLSRDLVALGATKSQEQDGRSRYVLDPSADTSLHTAGAESALARVAHELLLRAEAAGNIAVIHTPAGAAQFFAGHLDRSMAFDPVGSVAGDDTIIIVMRTPEEAAEFCTTLLRMADDRRTQ
jgi:transcriptional regulator of arginine metabolism